jgi:hypothetical protein
MVVTRSQTRYIRALLESAEETARTLDETPLIKTTGFQEYATAYKWVVIGSGRVPAEAAFQVMDHIIHKWMELPKFERKAWNDKAALYRFPAAERD